jgi:(2R)-3-sulfolactate dehydrogenase (NADP+)
LKTIVLTIDEASQLIINTLRANNVSLENATSVARALVAAQADGQSGHGLSRLCAYAAQAASGKVNGHAAPTSTRLGSSSWRIDAQDGFAFPALDLAINCLTESAFEEPVATAAIMRSHHFGQAGYHVERMAERGMIGLIFGNSPKAIAPWGGSKPLFGTNPIAFAAPRKNAPPLVIDLSLSKVARGKVMVAAKTGKDIPEGWALDNNGDPTTDPQAALEGSMIPMGDAKGAALVLMVEILAAALTGANYGFESSSFFDAEGSPPGVGQLLIAINPRPLSGGTFSDRLEILLEAILMQPGTRLPGEQKQERRNLAQQEGIIVEEGLYAEITNLCGIKAKNVILKNTLDRNS